MSKVTEIIETELMRPLESMQQIDRSVSVCVLVDDGFRKDFRNTSHECGCVQWWNLIKYVYSVTILKQIYFTRVFALAFILSLHFIFDANIILYAYTDIRV